MHNATTSRVIDSTRIFKRFCSFSVFLLGLVGGEISGIRLSATGWKGKRRQNNGGKGRKKEKNSNVLEWKAPNYYQLFSWNNRSLYTTSGLHYKINVLETPFNCLASFISTRVGLRVEFTSVEGIFTWYIIGSKIMAAYTA